MTQPLAAEARDSRAALSIDSSPLGHCIVGPGCVMSLEQRVDKFKVTLHSTIQIA